MRRQRRVTTCYMLGLVALLVFTAAAWSAPSRVATDNIPFLSTEAVDVRGQLQIRFQE
jgi:hypothetical protein